MHWLYWLCPCPRVIGQPPVSRLHETESSMQEVLLESEPMEEKRRKQVRVEGELGCDEGPTQV